MFSNSTRDGDEFEKSARCKLCTKEYMDAWRALNADKVSGIKSRYMSLPEAEKKRLREAGNRQRQERRRNNPTQTMLARARKRVAKSGLDLTIKPHDIIIGKLCPVLGTPMVQTFTGSPTPSSPSLDRIDSSKGYVPGNVAVISYRANTLKSDGTLEEFEAIVAYLRANLPAQQPESQQAA